MQPHEYVALEIIRERERQINAEGWSYDHDDQHDAGQMARAAAAYAWAAAIPPTARSVAELDNNWHEMPAMRALWRWDWRWWKPKNPRDDLLRAGALIVAEIERLDRAEQKRVESAE